MCKISNVSCSLLLILYIVIIFDKCYSEFDFYKILKRKDKFDMESVAIEHKKRSGSDALGESHAAKTRELASPKDGVPIQRSNQDSWEIIKQLERVLNINSWIDNV